MIDSIKWYLEFVERELGQLKNGGFTGNVGFKINFKEGEIGNMNIELNKSIKMIKRKDTYAQKEKR